MKGLAFLRYPCTKQKRNIMRTLVVLNLIALACTIGRAQADGVYNQQDTNTLRCFDIKNFNENQDGAGDYENKTDDMSIRQYTLYDSDGPLTGYIEDCRELHTPYSYYYRYDTKGRLRQMAVSFCGMSIGKVYFYDSLGRTTETIDYSEPYKFKLSDLIEKMKREYGCDLLNKKRVIGVHRSKGERDLKRPWYSVLYREEEHTHYGDEYLIDGTTGETLYVLKHEEWNECGSDMSDFYAMVKGLPTTIAEKYLYELNKKKGGQDKKGTKKKGKSFWRKLFD